MSSGGTSGFMDDLFFSPIGEATKPPEPDAAPKAPAPVTQEDPNVQAVANNRRRKLQSTRQAARVLSPSRAQTTLG